MSQLTNLKSLLQNEELSQLSDSVLEFYLGEASDIICDLRNTTNVEPRYLNVQVRIALELISKNGAEGQLSHTENGIGRAYESANVSPSLLNEITPRVKTPFSSTRVIV